MDAVQEMVIYGVSFDMVGKQPIVLLKTVSGNRFLPIWIGHAEAAAILMKLQGAETPRPMTHDLLNDVVSELNAEISKITVTELRENTFYALITLRAAASEIEIDSRPSDALALAVRTQRPDLRRRQGHRGERDRVRARGRGHRRGRREVQGVPRPGEPGRLPHRKSPEAVTAASRAAGLARGLALGQLQQVAVDLPQPLGRERPLVGALEVAVHPLLARRVDEVHALLRLVRAQAGDQLETGIDRRQEPEVGVDDGVAHLAHHRVGDRVPHGGPR